MSGDRRGNPDTGAGERVTDVNVGGTDGAFPDFDPPATVATVVVPYDGDDSRSWLWARLDEVRANYERRYGSGVSKRRPAEPNPGRFRDGR